jgi:hypothetical protein
VLFRSGGGDNDDDDDDVVVVVASSPKKAKLEPETALTQQVPIVTVSDPIQAEAAAAVVIESAPEKEAAQKLE